MGIEAAHGVTASPTETAIYASNEADEHAGRGRCHGRCNVHQEDPALGPSQQTSPITPDGRKVYVGIRQARREQPGASRMSSTPPRSPRSRASALEGPVHNLYVTPDGKYVVAGEAGGEGHVSVLDTQTDAPAWYIKLGEGIRPMAMSKNPDGSTSLAVRPDRRLQRVRGGGFPSTQGSRAHHASDARPGRIPLISGSSESHGMAVTADQKIARRLQPAEQRALRVLTPRFEGGGNEPI